MKEHRKSKNSGENARLICSTNSKIVDKREDKLPVLDRIIRGFEIVKNMKLEHSRNQINIYFSKNQYSMNNNRIRSLLNPKAIQSAEYYL